MSFISSKVYIFYIFQCLVLQMHILRCERTKMLPYKVFKLDITNVLFSKRNKNTKPTLCLLNFTLQT